MWFSLGIDFLINVVVTTWILISRSKHDGKEVVFNLSGGSHTGTTVLMVVFWVIFVFHLIFCISRSSREHHVVIVKEEDLVEPKKGVYERGFKFEQEERKRLDIVEKEFLKNFGKPEFNSKDVLKLSSYPFSLAERKLIENHLQPSAIKDLCKGSLDSETREKYSKQRITDEAYKVIVIGLGMKKQKMIFSNRIPYSNYLSVIESPISIKDRDIIVSDYEYEKSVVKFLYAEAKEFELKEIERNNKIDSLG